MDNSKDRGQVMAELQVLEQHLQNFLAQKQMALVDFQEINNALEELKKTKDEVYRVLSGVMIKSDREELVKELEEKGKIIELRINSIEKQESLLEEKAAKLRQKIVENIPKDKK